MNDFITVIILTILIVSILIHYESKYSELIYTRRDQKDENFYLVNFSVFYIFKGEF